MQSSYLRPLLVSALLWFLYASVVHATNIVIQVNDGANEGFNDPTPVAPGNQPPGNPGTTVGELRRNVFEAAAAYWEQKIDSDVTIVIGAQFNDQYCDPFSAILGSAGPTSVFYNFPNAPANNTFYPVALANALSNQDLNGGTEEIQATFNSALNGSASCLSGAEWNYAIGERTGDSLELYNTVLHEIAHGLGFLTLVGSNGQKFANLNDHYMVHLFDKSFQLSWADMSNAQRQTSYINNGNLVWTGAKAVDESDFLTAGKNTGNPRMYAPNPSRQGSSVSHWDTALTPNELMEPSSTQYNDDWLTLKAMYDMGWQGNPCVKTNLPTHKWQLISLDCVPPEGENSIADLFADDIAGGDYGVNWGIFRYNTNNTYSMVANNETLEIGRGYWMIQFTGTDAVLDIPQESHRTPIQNQTACTSGLGCLAYPLNTSSTPPGLWNIIGNPFRSDIKVSDLRVVTDSGACSNGCTLDEADTAKVFYNNIFITNSEGAYDTLSGNDAIPPRAGAWAVTYSEADGLNPRLLYPRP